MKSKGFTIVELLIVIIILGIMAALAIPQYNKDSQEQPVQETPEWVVQLPSAEGYQITGAKFDGQSSGLLVTLEPILEGDPRILDFEVSDNGYLRLRTFWDVIRESAEIAEETSDL